MPNVKNVNKDSTSLFLSNKSKAKILISDIALLIISSGAVVYLHCQGIDSQHPWTLQAIIGTNTFITGIILPILLGKNHSKPPQEESPQLKASPAEETVAAEEVPTPTPPDTPKPSQPLPTSSKRETRVIVVSPKNPPPPEADVINDSGSATSATAVVAAAAFARRYHATVVAAAATAAIAAAHQETVQRALVTTFNDLTLPPHLGMTPIDPNKVIKAPHLRGVQAQLALGVTIQDGSVLLQQMQQQIITQPHNLSIEGLSTPLIEGSPLPLTSFTDTSSALAIPSLTETDIALLKGIEASFLWQIIINDGQVILEAQYNISTTLTPEQEAVVRKVVTSYVGRIFPHLSIAGVPQAIEDTTDTPHALATREDAGDIGDPSPTTGPLVASRIQETESVMTTPEGGVTVTQTMEVLLTPTPLPFSKDTETRDFQCRAYAAVVVPELSNDLLPSVIAIAATNAGAAAENEQGKYLKDQKQIQQMEEIINRWKKENSLHAVAGQPLT